MKGSTYLSAGYVYAPYVPIVSCPTIPIMNTRVDNKTRLPNYNLTVLVAKNTHTGGIRMGYDTLNIHLGQVLECYITDPANVSLGIIPLVTGNRFLVASIWEYNLTSGTFQSEYDKDEKLRFKLVSVESNTWGEGVVSFALNFRQREPIPTDLEPGVGTAGGHICLVSGKNLREFIEKGNLRPYL